MDSESASPPQPTVVYLQPQGSGRVALMVLLSTTVGFALPVLACGFFMFICLFSFTLAGASTPGGSGGRSSAMGSCRKATNSSRLYSKIMASAIKYRPASPKWKKARSTGKTTKVKKAQLISTFQCSSRSSRVSRSNTSAKTVRMFPPN